MISVVFIEDNMSILGYFPVISVVLIEDNMIIVCLFSVIPHLKEMVNKTAKKGSEQTLECKVEADPPAIMTFTKVGSDKAFVDGEQPVSYNRTNALYGIMIN